VSLIIKYYPAHSSYPFANELLTTVLLGIYQTEEELQTHCAIEDEILRPAMVQTKDKRQKTKDESRTSGQEELSEREKEVVTLVVQGLINKEIAEKLHLSLHTVIAHRKNIARKLNIHSTAGLTIYAIVNKLIEV
jgi:regulator of cell morphogenesis and NO signaling